MQDSTPNDNVVYNTENSTLYGTSSTSFDGYISISAKLVNMQSLDDDIIQRFEKIERMVHELYYPYKSVAKNDQ